MSSKVHLEVLLSRLGAVEGLIDGAVPPVAFVATNALADLVVPSTTVWWAAGAALAAGASLLAARIARGESLAPPREAWADS